MDVSPEVWAAAHELIARGLIEARANTTTNSTSTSANDASRPPVYKAVGLTLAICSGLFIGTSFVLKKTGLLKANAKYNEEAGEGYGYLKNAYWWSGMTLMIVGEICNFVAYAFVDAILVTPLGALSVVVTTILSAIFLKERLSFVGKIGCFMCIIGSVVIVMNAPEQSAVADIQEMKHFVLAPGFLSYAGVIIVGCTFIAWWAGPRYGKKSMLVYLSICSMIGGLSVVATQGLGSAVVAQAGGKPQFNQWFLYLLLVFVVATLVTEIIFLNKALNLFNAALVTPTYYVFFTSATIVTSAILFQGFKGTAVGIATVIMGFLQICAGVVLLQLSKSAKDVPDAAVFKGDLDQVREVAEQEQPESEPKADAIRGTAALIRRISVSRQKMEEQEARRLREEKLQDQLEPLRENEEVHWDGLRRRKTIIGDGSYGPPIRRKTIHPPLGMSHFPEPDDNETHDEERHPSSGFFESLRNRTASVIHPHREHAMSAPADTRSPMHPVALTEINVHSKQPDTPIVPYGPGSLEEAEEHIYGLPPRLRNQNTAYSPRSKPLPNKPSDASLAPNPPPHGNRRQFSFTNVFRKSSASRTDGADSPLPPPSRAGMGSRGSSSHDIKRAVKNATEEERLGLVKGDSHHALLSDASLLTSSPPRQASPIRQTSSYPYTYSEEEDEEELSNTPPLITAASSHHLNRHATSTPDESGSDDAGWQITNPPHLPSASNPSSRTTSSPPRHRPIPPPIHLPPPPSLSQSQAPSTRDRPSGRNNNSRQVQAQAVAEAEAREAARQDRFPISSTSRPNISGGRYEDEERESEQRYLGRGRREESPEGY